MFWIVPPKRIEIYVSEVLNMLTAMSELVFHLSFIGQLWWPACLDTMQHLVKKGKEITERMRDEGKDLFPPLIHFPAAFSSCWSPQIQFICLFLCISQFLVWLKVSFFFKFECICHFLALTAAPPYLFFSKAPRWADHLSGNRQLCLSPSLVQSSVFLLSF